MNRLRDILGRALERTASFWPEVKEGAQWVARATTILANADDAPAHTVTQRYTTWLRALEKTMGARESVQHFLKVTRSYGDAIFYCYQISGLPRTNNALEQTFGCVRYHERRASGRKVASPSLVTDGSVRVPAALYTRAAPVNVQMLASVTHERWRARRAELYCKHLARRQRCRFRKHPAHYLAMLEHEADKLILLS